MAGCEEREGLVARLGHSNSGSWWPFLMLCNSCCSDSPGGAKGDTHEGRVRAFPHVRGNWATFVFIPGMLQTVGIPGSR